MGVGGQKPHMIRTKYANDKSQQQLARKRRIAGYVLLAEILTASLWRIGSWLCLFAGLWLLQIPTIFGAYGPGVFLAVFTLGLLWYMRRDLHKLHWPQTDEIDRRLEDAAQLTHRPLEIIEDFPVNGHNEAARKLWIQQRESTIALIRALRPPVPRAMLAKRDPAALRVLAVLLLVIGLAVAGPQAGERLHYGLMPYKIKWPSQSLSYMTLWITPPEYTGQAQITMQGGGWRKDRLTIPAGSILKARINSRFGQPHLSMGGKDMKMKPLDKKSWGIETTIIPGDEIRITDLYVPRVIIPYSMKPDAAPVITVEGDPKTMEKGELQFTLKTSDDYGVSDVTMHMELDAVVEDKPMGSSVDDTRAVMSAPGAEQELRPLYDLAWHPWAGLSVIITFTAHDHLGQSTTSEPVKITLPERSFNHPVAAGLIKLRKKLAWTPEASAAEVATQLKTLLPRPDSFANDLVVFLSIRSMASRLEYAPDIETATAVIAQLWDTAIRIEDGNLPLAARELRQAQQKLEKLLSDPNATQEEIGEAMDELREAMSEYFRELSREMQKRFAQGENMALPPELFDSIMNPDDLQNFMDQLQSQAMTGDKKSAREMLSQLQRLMDSLDPSTNMAMPPEMQFMEDGINELQQLIEKQRELLDQTEEQAKLVPPAPVLRVPLAPQYMPMDPDVFEKWGEDKMPPPPEVPPVSPNKKIDTSKHKVEQDALRYILGKLMLDADEMLGEIPEGMGKAEQEMRLSADELAQNDPADSTPHQQKAIEYLQDSMQDMSQQMAQQIKKMMMFSLGGGGKLDPLGRPMQEGNGPSWLPGSQVKIPDEAERKRVQEIQKLLRDRAGELGRPDYELDYFRRLLKQF